MIIFEKRDQESSDGAKPEGKPLKREKGFNLIELLIVLAIIGILTSIVYPGYSDYVIQSRRSEGIVRLLQVMQQQERYFTDELTYTADLSDLGYTTLTGGAVESENGSYQITAAVCTGQTINQCVLLTATPQGVQAGDGDLTLDSQGNRTPAGFWQ
ncbi:type IV pilin protein [Endozoicomonas sp.]|uniref:type IV pilin protein n=1 Tax=Endozoicomonas sp. TaxID=1892382 RepID=UPI002887542E|nr:type IV pilin protein [Endozoicomonas sp.]